MSTVEEIESAIENLKEDDFLRLAKSLEARVGNAWDHKINQDSKDGKLDFLFDEAGIRRVSGELKNWPSAK